MLQIEIQQINRIEKETGLTCLDDCIATLAKYYHCHYEMMYADGFEVRGNGGEYRFASNYHIRLVNGPNNLTYYHGMTLNKKEFFFKSRIKRAIKNEIEEGRPVMLLFDPFWCPWDWGFQQFTNEEGHCFIVRGVTEKGLVCADPYFEKEAEELPYEFFFNGIRGVYFVEYEYERDVHSEEYIERLKNLFEMLKKQNYYEGIYSLIDTIACRDDIFNEVKSDELFWRSPLVGLLLRINQSIQNIAVFVRYVGTQLENNSIRELGNHIWNLAITWKQARKLIIKLYFMKRSDEKLKEKTVEKMRLVVSELESMPKQIEEILMKKETEKLGKDTEREQESLTNEVRDLHMAKISGWMNNRAFIYEKDLENEDWYADFSSIGHCYIVDEDNSRDIWQVGNFTFDMHAIYEENMDNITCCGQKIPVCVDGCRTMALIGSAEFGCSTEIVKIIGNDGKEYEMEFQMTDYIYEPYYGETIAWQGKGVYKKEEGYERMLETVYLFAKAYSLPTENIFAIKLPINPSIHIFGITFEGDFTE